MIIIIDDIPTRHDILKEWLEKQGVSETYCHAYGYEDGIKILDSNHDIADHLFLDHDFSLRCMSEREDEKTGLDIARYMVFRGYNIPTTVISINPRGARRIVDTLIVAGVNVQYRPIFHFIEDFKKEEKDENSV